jgi:hypothetical protein
LEELLNPNNWAYPPEDIFPCEPSRFGAASKNEFINNHDRVFLEKPD